jgi:hypothetical protein
MEQMTEQMIKCLLADMRAGHEKIMAAIRTNLEEMKEEKKSVQTEIKTIVSATLQEVNA